MPSTRDKHSLSGVLNELNRWVVGPVGLLCTRKYFREPVNCLRVTTRGSQRSLSAASNDHKISPLSSDKTTAGASYLWGVGREYDPSLAAIDECIPGRRSQGIGVHSSARSSGTDQEPSIRRSSRLAAQFEQVIAEVPVRRHQAVVV